MLGAKKSQAWSIDLMVAVAIFLVGFAIFYIYSLNNPNEPAEISENLYYDGKIISNDILSEGYPQDWNSENVVKIGIMSNNKINETKLERFYNLAQTNYPKTKALLNTKYDYYFFFEENMIINGNTIEGIGKPGFNKNNINVINLIKITRLGIYKEKPIAVYLYILEE